MGSIKSWDNAPSVDVQQIRIVTVDPTTARVEGVMKDGAMIQVAVWDAPLTFRWPEEGETWRIYRRGIQWFLDDLVEDPKDVKSINDLEAGEAKIAASTVYTREGDEIVAIDVSTASEGEAIVRRGDGWNTEFVTGGGGEDAPYIHDQNAPSTTWVIVHNRNQELVDVTIYDTAGAKVIGQVHLDSNNQATVTFSSPFAGKALIR
jgi:hypothetical protein